LVLGLGFRIRVRVRVREGGRGPGIPSTSTVDGRRAHIGYIFFPDLVNQRVNQNPKP
jgi:hypothetical protein